VLWEANGALYPIKIKKTAKPDIRLAKVFQTLHKSGKTLGNGGIVRLYDDFMPLNENNFVIPARCLQPLYIQRDKIACCAMFPCLVQSQELFG